MSGKFWCAGLRVRDFYACMVNSRTRTELLRGLMRGSHSSGFESGESRHHINMGADVRTTTRLDTGTRLEGGDRSRVSKDTLDTARE